MCLISLPVEQVSNTNIFVGLDRTKTRQITIYSNYISNHSDANAMVIPVPLDPNTLSSQTIMFHDMIGMRNFFKNVDKSFYRLSNTPGYGSRSFSSVDSAKSTNSTKLEVLNVGSYKVSLVPSLSDLSRLDKNIFILSDGLANILTNYYKDSYWGFIVFVLAKDSKEYHPFAYSHTLLNQQIYIPTRHYHNHMSQPKFGKISSYLERNENKQHNSNTATADDWSHNIYLFNCGKSGQNFKLLQSMLDPSYTYGWDKNLYWNRRLIDFDLLSCDGFEKYHIEGIHPNLDLILPLC